MSSLAMRRCSTALAAAARTASAAVSTSRRLHGGGGGGGGRLGGGGGGGGPHALPSLPAASHPAIYPSHHAKNSFSTRAVSLVPRACSSSGGLLTPRRTDDDGATGSSATMTAVARPLIGGRRGGHLCDEMHQMRIIAAGRASVHTSSRADDDAAPAAASDSVDEVVERPAGDRYEAALAETVRKVKLLSLASLAATVVGTPLLIELSSPGLASQAKLTISLVVDVFGAFTTGLLQWFVSPYVLRMRMLDRDTVHVEKLTFWAQKFEEQFPVESMREADTSRPLVTWEAEGKLHYVEMAMVPQSLYDRLDLERFDVQRRAEREAQEAKRRGEEEEEED